MLLIIAYLSIKAGLFVPAFFPFKWQTRVLSRYIYFFKILIQKKIIWHLPYYFFDI